MTRVLPAVIDAAELERIADVSDETIDKDIADTRREIQQYRKVQQAEFSIATWHWSATEREMARFKADSRMGEIQSRQEFVDYLERVKAARAAIEAAS